MIEKVLAVAITPLWVYCISGWAAVVAMPLAVAKGKELLYARHDARQERR